MRGATINGSAPSSPSGFQSTHPMRGATDRRVHLALVVGISIHAPHAGCDKLQVVFNTLLGISIHAPHAGCDNYFSRNDDGQGISIHAPHAGCDYDVFRYDKRLGHFNPRTPCGVRLEDQGKRGWVIDFNPRTPCGVRPTSWPRSATKLPISIHAPHAGCDAVNRYALLGGKDISIHAPHAGCDPTARSGRPDIGDFNPRTPCGVRLDR